MTKKLIWILAASLVVAMFFSFFLNGCKTETEEAVEEAVEEVEEAVEEAVEEVEEAVEGMVYKEAPMLAEMVEAGELPPVEERLPADPYVYTPHEEIGEYGGTIRRASALLFDDERLITNHANTMTGFFTHGWPNQAAELPSAYVAESWDWNEDGTELTIHLRQGIKWSDGEPFTADDVMFYFHDVVADENVAYPWFYYGMHFDARGNLPLPEKIDDYTVKFEYEDPAYIFELKYASLWTVAMPEHHLSQWHPKYNSDSDYATFNEKVLWRNEGGKVTMQGWTVEEYIPDSKVVLTRNPYCWMVDTEGNQLPYIDKQEIYVVGDRPAVALAAITGEIDYDCMWVGFPHLSMFLEEMEKPDRDFHLGRYNAPGLGIWFNYDAPDEDSRAVIRDVNVRQAMSVAMPRPAISESFYFGEMTPIGCSWSVDSAYFDEESAFLYSEYDVEEAMRILDDADIMDRDGDGIRELPTGEAVDLVWDIYEHDLYSPMAEMIVGGWEAVGIKVTLNERHQSLHEENMRAGEFELSCYDFYYYDEPFMAMDYWIPVEPGAPFWHRDAYEEGGFSPEYDEYTELMIEAHNSPAEERIRLAKEANKIMAENVFKLHVGFGMRPYIISNRIGNFPTEGALRVMELGQCNTGFRPIQFYVKYE